jgi:ubiquinone/menaquinone biosynthesis C-methylase UbiE
MSNRDSIYRRRENGKSYRALFALITMAFSMMSFGTISTTAMAQREADTEKETPPKPLTTYMGRRIALTMSYHGIPWLNRSERIDEERPAELLEQLKLKDGMVVCDMGCGDGYHAFQMAPMVGPSGKVIAVDIQPEMLQELSRKMKQTEIHNIDTVLGELWDPKLDAESVDLLLMVDVYHEFAYPVQMLSAIRKSLKKDGLVALVEFRAEDPTVPIKPEHKMSKAQAKKEFKKNGFKLVREYEKLPWQHVMFFARDESNAEAGEETKN